MKIIIVDDDIAALSTFLGHIIGDIYIEYKMFMDDPAAAISYIKQNHVDAAFLDINMQEMNGIALAEQFIALRPDIKIVFITGSICDKDDIAQRIGANLLGFCYKPYSHEMLISHIEKIKELSAVRRKAYIRTFGAFDLFVGGKAVRFSSTKSKELLALLTDRNGAQLSIGEAVSMLWPDKNAENGKRLYRDSVSRLRAALQSHGIAPLVSFSRGMCVINKDQAECDLWNFYDQGELGDFSGDYMPTYDWSMSTQRLLENRILSAAEKR